MARSSFPVYSKLLGHFSRVSQLAICGSTATMFGTVGIAVLCALFIAVVRRYLRPGLKVPILLQEEFGTARDRRLAYCYKSRELMQKGYDQVSIFKAVKCSNPLTRYQYHDEIYGLDTNDGNSDSQVNKLSNLYALTRCNRHQAGVTSPVSE